MKRNQQLQRPETYVDDESLKNTFEADSWSISWPPRCCLGIDGIHQWKYSRLLWNRLKNSSVFVTIVATVATSAFFPVPSSSPHHITKAAKLGAASANFGGKKLASSASSGSLQVKSNGQAPPKINGTSVGLPTPSDVY